MEQQIVVFDLGSEHYGVDIASVESIIKPQAITRIPHSPSFVEGVTNLRGMVLPVIDLRKRFGLPVADVTPHTRIIVVTIGKAMLGMIVDAVSEVLSLSEGTIEPPSPIVTTVDSAFIKGIAKLDDRLIILVDLSSVLSHEEQAELEKV